MLQAVIKFYCSHAPLTRLFATDGGKAADFGRRRVAVEERTTLINGIFNYNAKKYDLVGSVFALGLHTGWKRELARKMGSLEGVYEKLPDGKFRRRKLDVLDTCGGTGDLTFHMLDLAKASRYYRTCLFLLIFLLLNEPEK